MPPFCSAPSTPRSSLAKFGALGLTLKDERGQKTIASTPRFLVSAEIWVLEKPGKDHFVNGISPNREANLVHRLTDHRPPTDRPLTANH